ncbi:PKD repeat-containing protein [Tenacibaculum sp. MAR_2009_124]|uniref:PKD domain-containing protein n=1 Tax=Tenacibaculum sp. MAR_2009_124 TaxID=1250059 RepID=UPI00089CD1CA|nr:PKD domain-containing protein [Tenacibaculum sp. MAR_2009_124]SEB52399.1 PKD repeat-containing protein [Tenacibaculum sp. MAR_2009_124]
MKKFIIFLVGVLGICACIDEVALPVTTEFEYEVVNNDFTVPVQVKIKNNTEGADTYDWTFEGGQPSTSTDKNPGTITYNDAGEFLIKLEASNRDGSVDIKTETIRINPTINLDFEVEVLENNFSPVEVKITNNTSGANSFEWFFQGGNIETSREEHPENIIFTAPGDHRIRLKAGNGMENHVLEKSINVLPYLEAKFDYSVAFEDDDYQVPVKINLTNNSISTTNYEWTFEGANISTSNQENLDITLVTPGTHSIKLKASNGKEEKEITKTITVFENTNIREFNNVKLGINTAHNTNNRGAFYSAITRQVYSENEITDDIGAKIDFVYFGLNESFAFNKFVSPDQADTTAFSAIPNSTTTKIINNQELCNCTSSMSVSEFDAMSDDSIFRNMDINETTEGLTEFSNSVSPRIVLFQTSDQRKGAVKVKQFVRQGTNSYIVVDIKIQKEAN